MTTTAPQDAPVTMSSNGDGHHNSAPVRLAPGERVGGFVVGLLVMVLGAVGFVNSFEAVAEAVEPSFGDLAWSVPVGIDAGIAVFTALDLLLARLDMRMRLLRVVPWGLVGVTIYLNVAGETEPVGAVAHGVLPLLWVLAVEVAAHVTRIRAGLARHAARPGTLGERPKGSVGFWRYLAIRAGTRVPWLRRGMVLMSERSYDAAVRRAKQQDLVRAELRDRYGRIGWRWRTPATVRVRYRWGALAPSRAAMAGLDDPGPAGAPASPVADVESPGSGRVAPTRRAGSRSSRKTSPDVSDVLPAAREAAAALVAQGHKVTRDTLRPALRDRGVRLATAKLGAVLAALRAEDTTTAEVAG